MNAASGQASAEYAGLLALATMLGAALVLVAAPPLVGALRDAIAAALARPARGPEPVTVSAADIADVQSALLGRTDAQTPDAALVALGRRHGAAEAAAVADALVLGAARAAAPWLGTRRTYRPWVHRDDGPYKLNAEATGDRDVEQPIGPPAVQWVTVAAQRRGVSTALAHHANVVGIALDVLTLIPEAGLVRALGKMGARPFEQVAVTRAREAIDTARITADAVELFESHDGDLPPGTRSGDVVVAWPVHRTAWRDGRPDSAPRIGSGRVSVRLIQDYVHLVFLRPGGGGLAVIAEGFGT
jgi:hypothetical protein